jgi:hypothetical protein
VEDEIEFIAVAPDAYARECEFQGPFRFRVPSEAHPNNLRVLIYHDPARHTIVTVAIYCSETCRQENALDESPAGAPR